MSSLDRAIAAYATFCQIGIRDDSLNEFLRLSEPHSDNPILRRVHELARSNPSSDWVVHEVVDIVNQMAEDLENEPSKIDFRKLFGQEPIPEYRGVFSRQYGTAFFSVWKDTQLVAFIVCDENSIPKVARMLKDKFKDISIQET